jgi:hypothetical protein
MVPLSGLGGGHKFLVGRLPINLYASPHGSFIVEFHSSLEKYPTLFGGLSSSPLTIVAYIVIKNYKHQVIDGSGFK